MYYAQDKQGLIEYSLFDKAHGYLIYSATKFAMARKERETQIIDKDERIATSYAESLLYRGSRIVNGVFYKSEEGRTMLRVVLRNVSLPSATDELNLVEHERRVFTLVNGVTYLVWRDEVSISIRTRSEGWDSEALGFKSVDLEKVREKLELDATSSREKRPS